MDIRNNNDFILQKIYRDCFNCSIEICVYSTTYIMHLVIWLILKIQKCLNHDYNFVDIDQMTEAPITDIQY